MTQYLIIRTLLIVALVTITYFLVRPTKTANTLALRRIGMLAILAAGIFAIVFPGIFNQAARVLGVASGTNLLLYLVIIVLIAQMASSYRRDVATQAKVTALAREVAILRTEIADPPVLDSRSPQADGDNGANENAP